MSVPERERDERRWSQWMAAANRGDSAAYEQLLVEISAVVEAYLLARFGAVDFLEDCVQECLLAVHRARASYDTGRAFRPWLFTIVRHKAIDLLRRRQVRRRDGSGLDLEPAPLQPADPATALEGARLLAQLDPSQREAIALTKYSGLTVAEAAERVGISRTAMRSRVHRALRELRDRLAEEGGLS
jgi:RNA polymerase sigma-70 factor (ECF subfamily)